SHQPQPAPPRIVAACYCFTRGPVFAPPCSWTCLPASASASWSARSLASIVNHLHHGNAPCPGPRGRPVTLPQGRMPYAAAEPCQEHSSPPLSAMSLKLFAPRVKTATPPTSSSPPSSRARATLRPQRGPSARRGTS